MNTTVVQSALGQSQQYETEICICLSSGERQNLSEDVILQKEGQGYLLTTNSTAQCLINGSPVFEVAQITLPCRLEVGNWSVILVNQDFRAPAFLPRTQTDSDEALEKAILGLANADCHQQLMSLLKLSSDSESGGRLLAALKQKINRKNSIRFGLILMTMASFGFAGGLPQETWSKRTVFQERQKASLSATQTKNVQNPVETEKPLSQVSTAPTPAAQPTVEAPAATSSSPERENVAENKVQKNPENTLVKSPNEHALANSQERKQKKENEGKKKPSTETENATIASQLKNWKDKHTAAMLLAGFDPDTARQQLASLLKDIPSGNPMHLVVKKDISSIR